MKILHVNCVYKKGSTGKIVADVHNELLNLGHESVVCYGRGYKIKEENTYKICGEYYSKFNNLLSRFTGLMYGGCFLSTNKLFRIIKREKPDVVHLHCINGYFVNIFRLIKWLKYNKIKTVLTLHAEFMHTANCGHAYDCEKWKTGCGNCAVFKKETHSIFWDRTHVSWKKMKRAFDNFDELVITSVSPWLMDRAKTSPILANKKHYVVLNGLDTSVFKYRNLEQEEQSNKTKTVFHATPSFDDKEDSLKGGKYVIGLAKSLPNIKFIVAGRYQQDVEVPNNLILLGNVKDQIELAKLYEKADVTLITSKRETFSMVLAESLCCGTPVVGFKAGAPEQIAISDYVELCEYGDIHGLQKAITNWVNKDLDKKEISNRACEKYNKSNMLNGYMKIYKDILRDSI